jgi:hypothetical protein
MSRQKNNEIQAEPATRGVSRRALLGGAAAAAAVLALPAGTAAAATSRVPTANQASTPTLGTTPSYPPEPEPSFNAQLVDQWAPTPRSSDIVPAAAPQRRSWATSLATDAFIFGLPAVYQYGELYQQAINTSSSRYTGFYKFLHQRDIATPTFSQFRVPNADNLYSTAMLDLTNGPVLITMPRMGDRYWTLNFLDAYAYATNISSRTVGGDGGRFLIATTDWHGHVPGHTTVFRVATQQMYILLRIARSGSETTFDQVHQLQDKTIITPTADARTASEFPPADATTVPSDWQTFFRSLDFVLRVNSHTLQEDADLYRFRALGLGGLNGPVDIGSLDSEIAGGLQDGFTGGTDVVTASRTQLGFPVPGVPGWNWSAPGTFGFAYLARATSNFAGLYGNDRRENATWTDFVDSNLQQLVGSKSYTWHTATRPPGAGDWSLTLYDLRTGLFTPNPINRYKVGSNVPGVTFGSDGSLDVVIASTDPGPGVNWLPSPADGGPFFLIIRDWQPTQDAINAVWTPQPVLAVN